MGHRIQQIFEILLTFLGAAAGGFLGYYSFRWIYSHGFYGMMIPGALLGLGSSLLSQEPSQLRGYVCAAASLGLGVFMEWKFFPFAADDSFRYFVKHILELNNVHLAMIAAGAFFAYWLAVDAGFRLWPAPRSVSAKID